MGIGEELISEIVDRILRVVQPERIILFGSAAAGTMSPDSDIDLLVIEESPGDTRADSVRIGDVLRGLGFPFDVIVISRKRYEETKDIIGGIAYPATKHGKTIYDAT